MLRGIQRERCPTGIFGLDEILHGGIPDGNTVLLTGTCGSGKTTLSMEFLVNGARNGETCAFFSVTEPSLKLIENLKTYDFYDESLMDHGLLNMFDMDVLYDRLGLDELEFTEEHIHAVIDAITDIVNEIGVTRLVIDSITTVCYKIVNEHLIRDFIFSLGKSLALLGCTSLLVSEIGPQQHRYSMHGVEEAISDGIVLLGDIERRGHRLRTIQVIKMRGTQHSRAKYVMELTPVGVILTPLLKWGSGP